MLASNFYVSNDSESELQEKHLERRDSEVMIQVLEERHVRILNKKSEIRRGRVPVSRHKSQRYNRELRWTKSHRLAETEPILSSSQPSLVALTRYHSEGAQKFDSNDEEDTNSIVSDRLKNTSEVNIYNMVIKNSATKIHNQNLYHSV